MKTPSDWEKETQVPLVTSCKQAARLVSISFERRLTVREFLSMRLHLLMCKTCTFYKRQITALRKIFVRHEEFLDSAEASGSEEDCLSPKTRQMIEDAIQKKAKDQ
jgi:hypothetical protein